MNNTTDHDTFWDCYEGETYTRRAHRLTPDADCRKVSVYECDECGNLFLCEYFESDHGDGDDETIHYGLWEYSTVESVLSGYGVEP